MKAPFASVCCCCHKPIRKGSNVRIVPTGGSDSWHARLRHDACVPVKGSRRVNPGGRYRGQSS